MREREKRGGGGKERILAKGGNVEGCGFCRVKPLVKMIAGER